MTPDPGDLDRVVRAALEEDLRYGPDVTTAAVIPPGTKSVADVVARQPGTLAGLPVVAAVLDVACPAATFTPQARDGDRVAAGDVVARVEGPLAEILTAERTLLNFLTHLSGIATATRAWVDAIDGTGAFVRDTRKTVPGLRALEKYAVRCGGGVNHRMGLGDAALIKDNHIAAAGGVTAAFRAVLAAAPGVVVEVECDTLGQVGEALAAGAALILLDNMSLDQMRSAVAMARAYPAAKLEASGGLRLENAREVASTGVHYLSVGALTHSSPALDLALDVGLPAYRGRRHAGICGTGRPSPLGPHRPSPPSAKPAKTVGRQASSHRPPQSCGRHRQRSERLIRLYQSICIWPVTYRCPSGRSERRFAHRPPRCRRRLAGRHTALVRLRTGARIPRPLWWLPVPFPGLGADRLPGLRCQPPPVPGAGRAAIHAWPGTAR